MKLSTAYWSDLVAVLGGISQREWSSTQDVRKCQESIKQIMGNIDVKEMNEANKEGNKVARGFEERALKETDEAKKEKIHKEFEEAIKPHNERIVEARKKAEEEKVEINLDGNFKAFIVSNWESKIRLGFKNAEEMLEIADALEIK